MRQPFENVIIRKFLLVKASLMYSSRVYKLPQNLPVGALSVPLLLDVTLCELSKRVVSKKCSCGVQKVLIKLFDRL